MLRGGDQPACLSPQPLPWRGITEKGSLFSGIRCMLSERFDLRIEDGAATLRRGLGKEPYDVG
jgi:hypothetical protein